MTADSDDATETALALALKRAAGEKIRKDRQSQEERRSRLQARKDVLRERTASRPQEPEPIPAPQTGAALQVSAQHFLQDKAAREDRIRQLTSIALGRSKAPEPVRPERLPPPPPSGPDDPRIKNGSLAPSPKVAAMLKATVSEAAAEAAAPKPRITTSRYPDGWLEILQSGTPEQILATRKFKDLKGDDLEAFNRARQREFDALLAGRKLTELPPEDRSAYYAIKTRHMRLMTDHTRPRTQRKGAARGPVGKTIDKLRHAAGLTADQVAEQSGVPKHRLTMIISGKRSAKAAEAALLGTFFHVNPEKFMPPTPATEGTTSAAVNGVTRPKTPKRPGYNPDADLKRLADLTEPRDSDSLFQANLRRIMRKRGLMAQHVAKLCGLSPDVPGRLLRTDDYPKAATREKLLAGLGVTAEELFGAPQAPVEAPVAPSSPAPVVVPPEPTDASSEPARATLVGPTVAVEMDVPMPPIVLNSDRYPWDMPKGGSFKAEVPFGMPWAKFRRGFLSMLDRQSEKLGHWYTYEENEAESLIRVWRYI